MSTPPEDPRTEDPRPEDPRTEDPRPEDPYAENPYAAPTTPRAGDAPYGSPAPGDYRAAPGSPYGAAPGTSPYGTPYGQPGSGLPRNGLGTAALVLGVIGLLLSIVVIGAVPGILAIIFGAIGRSRARRRMATNGGAALAGIITGVLAVAVAVALVAVGLSLIRTEFNRYRACMDNAQTFEQRSTCQDQFRRSIEDRFNR